MPVSCIHIQILSMLLLWDCLFSRRVIQAVKNLCPDRNKNLLPEGAGEQARSFKKQGACSVCGQSSQFLPRRHHSYHAF